MHMKTLATTQGIRNFVDNFLCKKNDFIKENVEIFSWKKNWHFLLNMKFLLKYTGYVNFTTLNCLRIYTNEQINIILI